MIYMTKLTKAQIEKELNELEMPFSSSQVDYIYKKLARQKKDIVRFLEDKYEEGIEKDILIGELCPTRSWWT